MKHIENLTQTEKKRWKSREAPAQDLRKPAPRGRPKTARHMLLKIVNDISVWYCQCYCVQFFILIYESCPKYVSHGRI